MITRPTLAELNARWQADVQARLEGATASLRRRLLWVLGAVMSAAHHSLYGFAQQIGKQSVPYTATGVDLEEWASLWGVARRQASTAAGQIVIAGTPGATVLEDARLQSSFGAEYRVLADGELDESGELTADVEAIEPGAIGNLAAGGALTFISAPAGVNAVANAGVDGIGGGADLELDDSLRARMLKRIQNPPHGGNAADYEFWALEVAAVVRAWVFPLYDGPGTVRVYVSDGREDGDTLAAGATVSAVQDYIDSVRPVTATAVDVVAPERQPVNIELTAGPDSPELRAAVEAGLAKLFLQEAQPEGSIPLTHISEVVSQTTGEYDHEITTPTESPEADAGKILTLGTVTWT